MSLNALGYDLGTDLFTLHLTAIGKPNWINGFHSQRILLITSEQVAISCTEVSPSMDHEILEGNCIPVTNDGLEFRQT